jgi:hypothetical protein
MRLLLATLFLSLSIGSAQAALNTESLPAGSVAIVGVDIAAFRASKIGQALEKSGGMKAKELEASRKLSEQLGIDPKNDLHDLVVAIYPGADGKVAEKNASGVVLIRGKFLPARINSFGKSNNIPSKTVGQHQAWEASAFIEKLSGEKPKNNTKDAYVVAHSESLVVIASAEFLERALAAADRKENSAQLPAAVAAKFAAAQNGWFYLYADATKMEKPKGDVGAEDLSLVLGENATDLQLAIAAGFVSAEKAATTRKQITGLQAIAVIGLSDDDDKSPEEKENMALLAELVQKIRIDGEGKQVTLDLDYPADKAVKAIVKIVEQAEKTRATPAAK